MDREAAKNLIRDAVLYSIRERTDAGYLISQDVVPVITGYLKSTGNVLELPNGAMIQYLAEYACIYPKKVGRNYPYVIGSEGERRILLNLTPGTLIKNGFGNDNEVIAIDRKKIYKPKLFKIKTESGKEMILTDNHWVPTKNRGLVQVSDLKIDDQLFVEDPLKHHIAWNKNLTVLDPRVKSYVRKNVEHWKDEKFRKSQSEKFKRNHWSKKRKHGFNYLGETKINCVWCKKEFNISISKAKEKRKYGRFCSRECESEWRKQKYSGRGNPHFGKQYQIRYPGGGYREDLGHYVRSTWEANFARILILFGITYVYEPRRFYAIDCSYVPDFWIKNEDFYVEVTGREKDSKRMRKILKSNPELRSKLFVLDSEGYQALKEKYEKVIPTWELKK